MAGAWCTTSSLVMTLMPGVVGPGTKTANKILNCNPIGRTSQCLFSSLNSEMVFYVKTFVVLSEPLDRIFALSRYSIRRKATSHLIPLL